MKLRSLVLTVGFLLLASTARAQSTDSETQPKAEHAETELTETQYDLLERAIKAGKNKDYEKAASYHRSILNLGESDVGWLNLGRTLNGLGQCKEAADAFRRVPYAPHLKTLVTREEVLSTTDKFRKDLEKTCPGELTVTCDPVGMSIEIKGRPPERCDQDKPLVLPPGHHDVTATYLGQTLHGEVDLVGLDQKSLTFMLTPEMRLAAAEQGIAQERWGEVTTLLEDHPINDERAWRMSVVAYFGASQCQKAVRRLEQGLRRANPGLLTIEALDAGLAGFDPASTAGCNLALSGLREVVEAENALPTSALWGWGMLGTGAGLATLALALNFFWVGSILDDLDLVGNRGESEDEYNALENDLATAQASVLVSIVAAGLLVTSGTVLTVLGYQDREERAGEGVVLLPWVGSEEGGVQALFRW